MSDDPSLTIIRPIRWNKLNSGDAERVIRERVKLSSNVIFGVHAFDRIKERAITEIDARHILTKGMVTDEPRLADNGLDWKVVVTRKMPSGREAGIVTVIFRPPSESLFVVTVEWMDCRK
jgi:hypothetical protein